MVMIYAFLKYSHFVTMEAIFFTFWYMLHIVAVALNVCNIKSSFIMHLVWTFFIMLCELFKWHTLFNKALQTLFVIFAFFDICAVVSGSLLILGIL